MSDPTLRFTPTDTEMQTQAQRAAIMLARGSEAQAAEALASAYNLPIEIAQQVVGGCSDENAL